MKSDTYTESPITISSSKGSADAVSKGSVNVSPRGSVDALSRGSVDAMLKDSVNALSRGSVGAFSKADCYVKEEFSNEYRFKNKMKAYSGCTHYVYT